MVDMNRSLLNIPFYFVPEKVGQEKTRSTKAWKVKGENGQTDATCLGHFSSDIAEVKI